MPSAFLVIICGSAVILQTISAQCIDQTGLPIAPILEALPNSLTYTLPNSLTYTLPYSPIPEQTLQYTISDNGAVYGGGGFRVHSFSSIGPTGIRVHSDNLAVEGPLSVTGNIPFLGVVTFEGPLPAIGQGVVAYDCGNGKVGIVSEGALGEGPGMTGLGSNSVTNGLAVGVTAGLTGFGSNSVSNGLTVGSC